MKLLAIIVNYKTADMTIEALDSLMSELEPIEGARVAVVDNASGDGSYARILAAVRQKPWADRVDVMASDFNGGFGYGNNLAIKRNLASSSPADYFYLLNSDAFPDPGALRALIDFMDSHPEVGIAGSYIHGPDGSPHLTAFRFPTLLSELEAGIGFGPVSKLLERWIVAPPLPETTTKVDWLAGASMIIRREVFERVGLFDEGFFLYFEETDLCRRAALSGYPTYYVRDSSVSHIGSVSTGLQKTANRMPRFWFESRRHYFIKNYGRSYYMAANLIWATGFSLWRIRQRIQKKPDPHHPRLLRDFCAYNFLPWT